MTSRVIRSGLQVDQVLVDFIEDQALPGTGVSGPQFWNAFAGIVARHDPAIRAALAQRTALQSQIDTWHRARADRPHDPAAYAAFLTEIGYLVPEPEDFQISTTGTDPEIAMIPGPQLVVPITNARFALNAANARWGSLYDSLYGTDALGDLPQGKSYDADRGARVIAWGRAHLDLAVPLAAGSWADIADLSVADGALSVILADPSQFLGYAQRDRSLVFLFVCNGLHIEVHVDRSSAIGAQDRAGISDIILESALTSIMDCEDSVATVDAADKVGAYRNWLGLMRGDLTEAVVKGETRFIRRLNPDRDYISPAGQTLQLKGRALMLVRNVGHLMTTPAVLDDSGQEISEGLLDAICTTLIAMHDLRKTEGLRNSRTGAVYVVKPKMHGPAEVALTDAIFGDIETAFGLPQNAVKLGIMDEERRTSANLKACILAAKDRVAFINTGFLDRTGDEIHTSMEAGPMVPKGEMRSQTWIAAYEDRNVDIGLACGFQGKAQIGKGMWAMPDHMAEMLRAKIAHPMAGANCAWVPSPTAATLHATHYHQVDVLARQAEILAGGLRSSLADLLCIPLAQGTPWSPDQITHEVENNAQGILGYVVRWIDQGIGCSKVPDLHDVALMEDRATCRISAQALANWLHHGVVQAEHVMTALRKMAAVVDSQNAGDPAYLPMAPDFDGVAFLAACDLVFEGCDLPSGYTEPVLHQRRQQRKLEA